jgi:hypothetical protein
MTDHDDVDRRWRAANRVPVGIAHTEASREVMDEIRLRIVANGQPVRKPRRFGVRFPSARRGVVLGSAVAVIVAGGAAAAATILSSTTEGAPGYCQAFTQATANVPYPAGGQAWRNWVLLRLAAVAKPGTTLHQLCGGADGTYVKGLGGIATNSVPVEQGEAAESAFCAWAGEWVSAEGSGDTATEAKAASQIAGALQWPASQAADPHPQWGPPQGDDLDQSKLGWFIPAQKAVQAGNVAQVAGLFSSQPTTDWGAQCSIYQPPADSDNGTVLILKHADAQH